MAVYLIKIISIVAIIVGMAESARVKNAGRLFEYVPQDAHDPANVSLLKQALAAMGINTNGIIITSFYAKWWGLGDSYQVSYINANGQECNIHFRSVDIEGLKVDGMPVCDSRAIGNQYSSRSQPSVIISSLGGSPGQGGIVVGQGGGNGVLSGILGGLGVGGYGPNHLLGAQ